MARQAWIAAFISLCLDAALFGLGAAAILAFPGLGTEVQLLLPVVVLAGVLAAPFAAERLSSRLTPGRQNAARNRLSSGRTYPRGG